MMFATEEKVRSLETVLGEFIVHTKSALVKLENEMSEFKNEMRDFKEESVLERRKTTKQWGDLANKMGTLVEDIIVPGVRPVLEKYFQEEISTLFANVERKSKKLKLQGEFDVVAISDTNVFIVETRSTPRKRHIEDVALKVNSFRDLFPEYSDKKCIMIFASLSFKEEVINEASRNGIYVLQYREWEYLDLINFDQVKSKKGKNTKSKK
ncbi:MAG: hypothetical protein GF398_18115 [Chitinivibrionales bacterium]|nr:hypothetical protein [Chitinivibrionales bacterium]